MATTRTTARKKKEPEEAIAAIQRSITLIDQKFGELDKEDLWILQSC